MEFERALRQNKIGVLSTDSRQDVKILVTVPKTERRRQIIEYTS